LCLLIKEGIVIDFYLYLFMAGTALVVSLIALKIFEFVQTKFNPWQRRLQSLRAGPKRERESISQEDLVLLGGCIGGMLFAMVLTWGNPKLPVACMLGAGMGGGIVKFFQKNAEHTNRMKKLREIAVLSETIDFLTQVGYSIPQALRYGATITPVLRPHVEKCINNWATGAVSALNRFSREVGIPEAATLTSVLTHAQESGHDYARAAIKEEARSLEMLRETLSEISILSKPTYFAVYRGMPLAAILGLLIGPLIYRLTNVMGSVFGF
jgi:hypothetical protein